jgi:hypothetical protein
MLKMTTKRIITTVLFFSIFSLLLGGIGFPADDEKESKELPRHYPLEFTGTGRIDRMAQDEIVIDDRLYGLSPHTTYNIPTHNNVSRSNFRVGQFVGYITEGNRQIISLWLIEQPK